MRLFTSLFLGSFAITLASPTSSPVDVHPRNEHALVTRSTVSSTPYDNRLYKRGVFEILDEVAVSLRKITPEEAESVRQIICGVTDFVENCVIHHNLAECYKATHRR